MKKPGYRSGTKETIGEKHKEKDVKNMSIAYGIKGKTTAEKEAYGRRKIWSREKKEQERGL